MFFPEGKPWIMNPEFRAVVIGLVIAALAWVAIVALFYSP
jgi:hypothetical protein